MKPFVFKLWSAPSYCIVLTTPAEIVNPAALPPATSELAETVVKTEPVDEAATAGLTNDQRRSETAVDVKDETTEVEAETVPPVVEVLSMSRTYCLLCFCRF